MLLVRQAVLILFPNTNVTHLWLKALDPQTGQVVLDQHVLMEMLILMLLILNQLEYLICLLAQQ